MGRQSGIVVALAAAVAPLTLGTCHDIGEIARPVDGGTDASASTGGVGVVPGTGGAFIGTGGAASGGTVGSGGATGGSGGRTESGGSPSSSGGAPGSGGSPSASGGSTPNSGGTPGSGGAPSASGGSVQSSGGAPGSGGTLGGGTGGGVVGTNPCAGLCAPAINVLPQMNSGLLGTMATCHEVVAGASPLTSITCGNFVAPRMMTVNTVTVNCNGGGVGLPPQRNGGWCMQTTAGETSSAYFTTF